MIKIRGIKETLSAITNQFEKERQFKVKKEKESILQNLRDETPVDTGEARDGWYATDDSISNDTEHIKVLNQGSSKQAPAYFIERTVLQNPHVKVKGNIVQIK